MARTSQITALPTTNERVSVLEERVGNMDEKVDEIKTDVKELNQTLQSNKIDLLSALKEMRTESTMQHNELAGKINDLEQFRIRWLYMILGGIAVLGWLSGNWDSILKILN